MAKLFTQSLEAMVLPRWLSNRVKNSVGFKFLWVLALQMDIMVEYAVQGVQAAYPGLGTPTALPLIGQTRGIPQGPNESNAAYATHLQQWLTIWQNAGSEETLAQEVQRYLTPATGPLCTVRVVTRAGNTYTANPDGSITLGSVSWNWDGLSGWVGPDGYHPPSEVANWWSDIWILVSPDPFPQYSSFSDPLWLAAWANPSTGTHGIGADLPPATADGLVGVISAMKGAHQFVRAIVFCNDVTAVTPDGTWGNNVYIATPSSPAVIGRNLSFRYLEPFGGG